MKSFTLPLPRADMTNDEALQWLGLNTGYTPGSRKAEFGGRDWVCVQDDRTAALVARRFPQPLVMTMMAFFLLAGTAIAVAVCLRSPKLLPIVMIAWVVGAGASLFVPFMTTYSTSSEGSKLAELDRSTQELKLPLCKLVFHVREVVCWEVALVNEVMRRGGASESHIVLCTRKDPNTLEWYFVSVDSHLSGLHPVEEFCKATDMKFRRTTVTINATD